MTETLKLKLKKNETAYDKNFLKLEETVGTPEHQIYVKEERRLNKKDVLLRKRMGFYLTDPCPTNWSGECVDCTGYYRKNQKYYNFKGRLISRNYQCAKEDSAYECNLKNIRI